MSSHAIISSQIFIIAVLFHVNMIGNFFSFLVDEVHYLLYEIS